MNNWFISSAASPSRPSSPPAMRRTRGSSALPLAGPAWGEERENESACFPVSRCLIDFDAREDEQVEGSKKGIEVQMEKVVRR